MKAESTVRKQLQALRRFITETSKDQTLRANAFEASCALQWVLEDTDWTPVGMLQARDAEYQARLRNGDSARCGACGGERGGTRQGLAGPAH